jgi:hypothetical protein
MTSGASRSSDGKQIVFDSRVGGEANVHVMDANGGVPRKLETGTRMNSLPSWSHDGRWIYDGGFDEACPNSETPQDPPALNAKEPNEPKLADPEDVRRFLARATRLLASSPKDSERCPRLRSAFTRTAVSRETRATEQRTQTASLLPRGIHFRARSLRCAECFRADCRAQPIIAPMLFRDSAIQTLSHG